MRTKKKKHCVRARQCRFCLASAKSSTTSFFTGKNTSSNVRLGREQHSGSIQTFFSRSKQVPFLCLWMPQVFMMLEYNWYGQVSETNAPALTEIMVPKWSFARLLHRAHLNIQYSSMNLHFLALPWISFLDLFEFPSQIYLQNQLIITQFCRVKIDFSFPMLWKKQTYENNIDGFAILRLEWWNVLIICLS